jgi:hypothetical protein
MVTLDKKEVLVVIAAIDELLLNQFHHDEHLTDEQRDKIAEMLTEYQINSVSGLRNGFLDVMNKLTKAVLNE